MPTINTSNEEYQLSAENNQSSVTTNEVRDRMKDYWIKHSQLASIQEMLLDSNAEEISDQEMPEILSMLPSFKGKKVLELGAGIGRFTNVLAKQAESVIAVDFIEKFIKKNEEINAHLNNIEFVHGDVTKLAFETNAFHIIFSNWLLMYLNDEEVLKLFEKSLRSLKEGGYFFFRESCFHASGNIKKCDNNENPTEYRSPAKYIDFIQSRTIEENEIQYGFELVLARPNRTYIEMKNNGNQVCFLFQKVKLESHHGFKTLKEFFDHKQYTLNGILRYEKIYGNGFMSTGGKETTDNFLKRLDLKIGQRVLDVGCGVGGVYVCEINPELFKKYGVEVFGLDLSSNSISICWERAQNYKHLKLRFEIGDVTKHEYPPSYFDVIHARDSLLHISNKKALFNKFKNWLKPGGKLLITDYCCGPKPWSDEFIVYVEQRGYDLLTTDEYKNALVDAGFVNVTSEDKTEMFADYLNKELDTLNGIKEEFIQEFSISDFNYLVDGWNEKIVRTKQGHQKWGCFYAEKKSQ